MRTTPEENTALGRELAAKLAGARPPATVVLPLRGVSAIDRAGQSFDDPQARAALFEAIRAHAGGTRVVEVDAHVNDPAFAERLVQELVSALRARAG